MTCHCSHTALCHQYRASTAANDGECLAPQCPCGGYESGEQALGMGGLGVGGCDNESGPEGALTPTPALTPHHSTTPRSAG